MALTRAEFLAQYILFCVYFDGLLYKLMKAGYGCYIGYTFVGVLAHADDVVLLAPSANAMHKMLWLCDNFASDYDVKFNANKSKCLSLAALIYLPRI